MRHCFRHEVNIKVVFILKYLVSYSPDLDSWLWRGFHRLRTNAAHKNVWFRPVIEFTFSYAIQEKFTAWRVNSTLNTLSSIRPQVYLLAMRFQAKYPLFDSQSDREFTFSYAIL